MNPLPVVLALASAAVWGSGDFFGGLATRRAHQFHVLALSALSGMVVLVALAGLLGETTPSQMDLLWSAVAGLSGAIGIASLYKGLAIGSAATVAPTAAVLTAALPVVFSALTTGLPRTSQVAGFAVAIAGIWLVAKKPGSNEGFGTGLPLALLAGSGFGGFLILIAQVDPVLVFAPLAVARAAMLATALALMLTTGVGIPSIGSNPLAVLAGVFDAGGNVFYLLARQQMRLDVAAVLSSLYPVATVVLARIASKDPVTRTQWIGVGVCLASVGLIVWNPSSDASPRQVTTVARPAGSWQGTGSRTIGFVSESGVFRINWKTGNERQSGSGRFQLTVRSAISGRPIRVVADHRGAGSGTVDFADDPRIYDFLVDSANVDWSISVEELFNVPDRQ